MVKINIKNYQNENKKNEKKKNRKCLKLEVNFDNLPEIFSFFFSK